MTGPLCARDYKGVGNEFVNEGKVVLVDGVGNQARHDPDR